MYLYIVYYYSLAVNLYKKCNIVIDFIYAAGGSYKNKKGQL